MPSKLIREYMRTDHLPHIWCPGCGHGTLTRALIQAIDGLVNDPKNPVDRDKIVIVSGIGCSSRAVGYLDFNTLHTTHGRALAFATGVKVANPELTVIVVSGDGDCSAIGGNHLIHACRRNIDLTLVVYNNGIYGMTGGQYSPTTPEGEFGTTAVYGVVDHPFDIVKLAQGAGATFTARGDVFHARETSKMIASGIRHKGFSVIDCVSVCPTYYGRKNKKGDVVQMLTWQKEHGISIKKYGEMTPEEQEWYYPTGIFNQESRPEYTEEYQKLIHRAMEGK